MKNLRRLEILALAGATLAGAAAAQILDEEGKYKIEYRFEKGQRFRYRNTIDRTRSWPAGMSMKEVNKETEEWILEVLSGGPEPSIKVTRARYAVERHYEHPLQRGNRLRFDSQGLSEDELIETARREPRLNTEIALIGKSYVVRIDRHGEVLGVEGLEEYAAAIRDIVGEGLGVEGAAQFDLFMKSGEAERRMAEGVRIASCHLPPRSVALAESWRQHWSRNIAPIGRLSEKATLTLDRVEGVSAHISFQSEATFENVKPVGTTGMGDWYRAAASKETASGSIEFDLEKGLLLRFDGTGSFTLMTDYPIPERERPPEREIPKIEERVKDQRVIELLEILEPRGE